MCHIIIEVTSAAPPVHDALGVEVSQHCKDGFDDVNSHIGLCVPLWPSKHVLYTTASVECTKRLTANCLRQANEIQCLKAELKR